MPPQIADRRTIVWFWMAAPIAWLACSSVATAVEKTKPESQSAAKSDASDESSWPKNVEIHRPKLPKADPGSELVNPIDLLLQSRLKSAGVDLGHTVPDAAFARRVYLDLIGLLPSSRELDAFVADRSSDKRAALVRQLLSRREDYAVHWLAYWNDLLRNEYRGTGFIDDGRRQITAWLFRALYENKPYDQFVHELVSPVAGSEGFVKGIEWRGVVNASQRREMQAAQTVAQVFLGTNLKCASCHDSFISQWTLADSHGLAAIFADEPLDVYRCDKFTGRHAPAKFLFAEVGTIDPKAPRAAKMKQLADVMTGPKDGRLAKTLANRFWARLMGRGLVEPLDDMERDAWYPALLDWLAADLVDHHYDAKRTLEVICTSRTFQLPAEGELRPNRRPSGFRGPVVRRMTAEQFLDSVATLTDVWPAATRELLKRDGRGQGGQVGDVLAVLATDGSKPRASSDRVRAALAMDGALSRALGRPNREQVVTRRDSLATMLQALELTNGTTLDGMLKHAAHDWIGHSQDPSAIVDRVYRNALGRDPTQDERKTAAALVGNPATADGIQDLMWTVLMLPEFQLIE